MKRLLQLFLALVLVHPTPMPEDKKFHYVDFGSSQAAGYGLHGFVPEEFYEYPTLWYSDSNARDGYYGAGYVFHSERSYPLLIEKELKARYGANNVEFSPMAINAMRSRDLLYVLDNSLDGDTYFNSMVMGYIDDIENPKNAVDEMKVNGEVVYTHERHAMNLHDDFIAAIEDADLISYDLGINDFGGFLMNVPMALIAAMYGFDFSFGTDMHDLIPAKYADIYETAKGYAFDILAKRAADILPQLAENPMMIKMVEELVNTLAYSLVGYITAFDQTMEIIYNLNPDVDVVVVDIDNIYEGFNINLLGLEIPFGDIIGALMTVANAYTSYFSPYVNKYYKATFDGHPTTFIRQLENWDETMDSVLGMRDFQDCLNVYCDNVRAQMDIKKEIAAEKNAALHVDFTYEEWMENRIYTRTVEAMKREEEAKTAGMYYAFAKACKMASKETLMDMDGMMDGDSIIRKIKKIANEANKSYNGILSVKRNQEIIAGKIDEAFANGSFTKKDAQGLLGSYLMSFGVCFMVHLDENGHRETARAIMNAYDNKVSVKNNTIKTMIDALPDVTMADIVGALMFFGNRYLSGDTINENLDVVLDDINTVFEVLGEALQGLTPYVTEILGVAKQALDFLELTDEVETIIDGIANDPTFKEIVAFATEVRSTAIEVYELIRDINDFILVVDDTFVGKAGHNLEAMVASLIATMTSELRQRIVNTVNMIVEGVEHFVARAAEIATNIAAFTARMIAKVSDGIHDAAVSTIKAFVDAAEAAVTAAVTTAVKVFKFVASIDYRAIFEGFVAAGVKVVTGIVEFAESIAAKLQEAALATLQKVVESASKFIENTKIALSIAYAFVQELPNIIVSVRNMAIPFAMAVVSEVTEKLSKAYDNVTETIGKVINAVKYFVNEFIPKATEAVQQVALRISITLINVIGLVRDNVETVVTKVKENIGTVISVAVGVYNTAVAYISAFDAAVKEMISKFSEAVVSVVVKAYTFYMDNIEYFELMERIIEESEVLFVNDIRHLSEQLEVFFTELAEDTADGIEFMEARIGSAISGVVSYFNQRVTEMVKGVVSAAENAYTGVTGAADKLVTDFANAVCADIKTIVVNVDAVAEAIAKELHFELDVEFNFDNIIAELKEVIPTIETYFGKAEDATSEAAGTIWEAIEQFLINWNIIPGEAKVAE